MPTISEDRCDESPDLNMATSAGKVLVIEDVVTSAGSAAYAIEVLRQAGAEVDHVLSVVDREEGGREKLESMSTKLHALVTASDVLGQR